MSRGSVAAFAFLIESSACSLRVSLTAFTKRRGPLSPTMRAATLGQPLKRVPSASRASSLLHASLSFNHPRTLAGTTSTISLINALCSAGSLFASAARAGRTSRSPGRRRGSVARGNCSGCRGPEVEAEHGLVEILVGKPTAEHVGEAVANLLEVEQKLPRVGAARDSSGFAVARRTDGVGGGCRRVDDVVAIGIYGEDG